ncbi:hypothetical protein QYM36_016787, partial [Artemia franciscana]
MILSPKFLLSIVILIFCVCRCEMESQPLCEKPYDRPVFSVGDRSGNKSERTINVFVLGPKEYSPHLQAETYAVIKLKRMLSAVTVAVQDLQIQNFSKWRINIMCGDSKCSSTKGPLSLIEVYKNT